MYSTTGMCIETASKHVFGRIKGVGPSTTLALPGWKQPDIPMKVDSHDWKQAGSRKVV
jgi:hypothetical protein